MLAVASPARAQQLTLQIHDGRVTLDAADVPARQILAEWARIGGTKVVGAEKITGPPLTLKLVGMPERQALDIILGSVAGFMAAERQASATPGASVYDRILILATSSAPAATAASARQGGQNPNAPAATAGTQRRVPPRPPMQAAEETDESERENTDDVDQAAANANPPVFTFPRRAGGNNNPVFVPMNHGNAKSSAARSQEPCSAGDHAAAQRQWAADDLQLRAQHRRFGAARACSEHWIRRHLTATRPG